MSEPRVLRYEVPVDDGWHEISYDGGVVFVAARDPQIVEFITAGGLFVWHLYSRGVVPAESVGGEQQ